MDKNNFINRLKVQIFSIFNRKITERLQIAYHEDPIEFIGLFLTLIPLIILSITVIVFILCVLFFKDSTITKLFSSNLFGILGIFMILFIIGSFILSIKHRDDDIDEESYEKQREIKNPIEKKIQGKSIFVVHGHDSKTKEAVTNFLKDLDLIPVVLQDEPSHGTKTIIEKVEYYVKQTTFAIVILTKDDFGVAKADFDLKQTNESIGILLENGLTKDVRNDPKNWDKDIFPMFIKIADLSEEMLKHIRPRARQNVIFELGITFGYLNRDNVVMLYEEDVELPTDIKGLVHIPLNTEWKKMLIKELITVKILDKDIKIKFVLSSIDLSLKQEDISHILLATSDFESDEWIADTLKRSDKPDSDWQYWNTFYNTKKDLKVDSIVHRYDTINEAKEGFSSNKKQYASTQIDGRLFAPQVGEESYGYVSPSNVEVATFRTANLLVTTCFYFTKNRNSIKEAEHFAQLVDQKIRTLINKKYIE